MSGRRTGVAFVAAACAAAVVFARPLSPSPLSGGAAHAEAPPGRFTIEPVNGDVVYDALLGVYWQRQVSSVALAYYDSPPNDEPASAYCEALSLVTFTRGFRLATVEELESIIDIRANPTWDARFFPLPPPPDHDAGYDDPHGLRFWTKTPLGNFPLGHYYVDFDDGSSDSVGSYVTLRLRCVHDGP